MRAFCFSRKQQVATRVLTFHRSSTAREHVFSALLLSRPKQ
jgi:hypothetical protein